MSCVLVKNGKNRALVVIPENASPFEKIAADIVVRYIYSGAGVKPEIVTESVAKDCLSRGNDKHCIYTGNTSALKNKNLPVRHDRGGFTVKEADSDLFIFGHGRCGVIWAAQAFLEKAVGYKFFAADEIEYDKTDVVDVTGYDFYFTPSIENRASGFFAASKDSVYATGLKAMTRFGGLADGSPFFGTWNEKISCHNHLTILPPDKYYKDHPEWYDSKKNQLCLTNPQMRDEFFKNLIEYFKAYPNQTHFLLGHEDNEDVCECERCRERAKAVTVGGLYMEFINDMARRTEKWRQENCPQREISLGTFAYITGKSMTPPVKTENGKIVPVSESVVAEPNVFVMFAPIGQKDHSRPITDKINEYYYKTFERWNVVCKRFGVWFYYGTFRRSLEFTDGIYAFKENVTAMKNFGCEYFYVECNNTMAAIAFQKMHLYVLTRLEYDCTLDTDELIDEFMRAYYRCAAKDMRRLFDYVIAYYSKLRKVYESLCERRYCYGMCQDDANPQFFWSLDAIYDLTQIIESALTCVNNADLSDEEKIKITDRIELEKLAVLNIQLEYFMRETSGYDEARSINAYTLEKSEKLFEEFKKGCEKFGITSVDGDGTLSDTLLRIKKKIEGAARGWENRIIGRFARIEELCKEYEE